MVSTGTFAFAPASSDIVLNAFSRIQHTGSQITTEHLVRAAFESNLSLVKLSNRQPNLWVSELGSLPLTQGVATYAIPATVVDITIIYLAVTQGGVTTDRVLGPVSTTEYAAYPDKATQGPPTSYWFNRLITPELTFWPVPDNTATYVCKYRYLKQIQDTSLKSGTTPDMPWRWLDAYCDDLTARLARHYKPELYAVHKTIADESWNDAAGEDTEGVNTYIVPGLSAYYR